jgi:hypothetical protein
MILGIFLRTPEVAFSVIPAKAGIQSFPQVSNTWTPVFTGVTTSHQVILLQIENLKNDWFPSTLNLI